MAPSAFTSLRIGLQAGIGQPGATRLRLKGSYWIMQGAWSATVGGDYMDVSVSRIAEDNIRAGNSGMLLVADNYDAFDVRVLAARSSIRTLDLMYYLWHDDHTGRLLLQEVFRAYERACGSHAS